MKAITMKSGVDGILPKVEANANFVVIQLPLGAKIETQAPAGMAPGKVRSVIVVSAIEDDPKAPKKAPLVEPAPTSETPVSQPISDSPKPQGE